MGHLWLIGMMGSGKTTIGAAVASSRSLPFYDTDMIVEHDAGASIPEIFERLGEAEFRRMESLAVSTTARAPAGVVATGGGVVLDPGNVAAMRASGTTVLVDVNAGVLTERLRDACARPLLADPRGIGLQAIAADRAELYRAAADVVVDGIGSIEAVCERVEAACRRS
jgi:shikimate kinase